MADDYAFIAPIYDKIGMASFAEDMTPRLINWAQSNDWVGRSILDLGCGTGRSAQWLANQLGLNVTAIDASEAMLTTARQNVKSDGLPLRWQSGDMRHLELSLPVDMVLALNVLNELNSLRELEAVFNSTQRTLEPGKLFIFDLYTIQGLAEAGTHGGRRVYSDDDTVVFAEPQFDYERLMTTTTYTIFRRDTAQFVRGTFVHTQRGFPVQAVAALLQRTGFSISALLTTSLDPFDPAASQAGRVIFFALTGATQEST
ncbi:MAG: class I SAM-dependent methyltransferase [Chloroflexi bacterium]|nr:class I SAM-dependent methyltransferase [Chloroflexota bacterium]